MSVVEWLNEASMLFTAQVRLLHDMGPQLDVRLWLAPQTVCPANQTSRPDPTCLCRLAGNQRQSDRLQPGVVAARRAGQLAGESSSSR